MFPFSQRVHKNDTRKIAIGYYRLSSPQIGHDPTMGDMFHFHLQARVLKALCDEKGWLLGAVFFIVSNTDTQLQPWMTVSFELLSVKIL